MKKEIPKPYSNKPTSKLSPISNLSRNNPSRNNPPRNTLPKRKTDHIRTPPEVSLKNLYSHERINLPMLLLSAILVAFGLIVLFSASMATGYKVASDSLYFVMRQSGLTFLGLLLACVLIFIPIKFFDRISFVVLAYGLSLGLVVFTLLKGTILQNARRWITIGGSLFQPSELVKIAFVFCIAGYRSFVVKSRKKRNAALPKTNKQLWFDSVIDIVLPAIAIFGCLGIILLQPHLSFFVIMSLICGICFLVSGISWSSWIRGGVILIGIVFFSGIIFWNVSTPTQKEKITENFQHVIVRLNIYSTLKDKEEPETTVQVLGTDITAPQNAPQPLAQAPDKKIEKKASEDELYQSQQSLIAIGSGGKFGLGFGNSRQKFSYLPEAHNDYIFSTACEELGFAGGLAIILLFLMFLLGGLSIAFKTTNDFNRILAVGYTCLIVIQAMFNIGVTVGVLPPTGVTLPFFSYGGTANLFFLIGVGLLLAVSKSGQDKQKKITHFFIQ